jgi:hypothetical protein
MKSQINKKIKIKQMKGHSTLLKKRNRKGHLAFPMQEAHGLFNKRKKKKKSEM